MKAGSSADDDLELGSVIQVVPVAATVSQEKESKSLLGVPPEVLAGAFWCFCSFSMILTNKLLLSSFEFSTPISLLFIQFLMTVVLIDVASLVNVLKREPLDWKVIQLWWPVNVIFVAMIGTGFYTLKTLQVPMVTLLKNLTNLLSILGDIALFGKRYSIGVWASLGLMTLSAGVGSMTDLEFDLEGYLWMLSNCVLTAGYALYLKSVLNRVDEVTSSKGLSDISKVYYNHLLGLPWLLLLSYTFGETSTVLEQPALRDPGFVVALAFSGLVGFGLSYSSIRFMGMTTVTTYVMVGSFNKIPTAVLGWIIFRVKTTAVNVVSVLMGLSAGIVFVRSKAVEKQ